jgi:hypothetical protein
MPKRAKSRFTPHAILETENRRPSSIWMASLLNVEKLLRIDFPRKLPSACFMRFALTKVPERGVPAFGRVVSVVVNFREDFVVRYSLTGAVIEVLENPVTIGAATLVLDPEASEEDHHLFERLTGSARPAVLRIDHLLTIH